jgi:hypothetical protein
MADIGSSDFDMYGYAWYSYPYPYVDDFQRAEHRAGLYPNDGASYSSNNTEQDCWNLTVYGASSTSC